MKILIDDLLLNIILFMIKKVSDYLLFLRGLLLFKIIYNRKCDVVLVFVMVFFFIKLIKDIKYVWFKNLIFLLNFLVYYV